MISVTSLKCTDLCPKGIAEAARSRSRSPPENEFETNKQINFQACEFWQYLALCYIRVSKVNHFSHLCNHMIKHPQKTNEIHSAFFEFQMLYRVWVNRFPLFLRLKSCMKLWELVLLFLQIIYEREINLRKWFSQIPRLAWKCLLHFCFFLLLYLHQMRALQM